MVSLLIIIIIIIIIITIIIYHVIQLFCNKYLKAQLPLIISNWFYWHKLIRKSEFRSITFLGF